MSESPKLSKIRNDLKEGPGKNGVTALMRGLLPSAVRKTERFSKKSLLEPSDLNVWKSVPERPIYLIQMPK